MDISELELNFRRNYCRHTRHWTNSYIWEIIRKFVL